MVLQIFFADAIPRYFHSRYWHFVSKEADKAFYWKTSHLFNQLNNF
jgi:hypothetical protein